ncbi:Uncharacterized protein NEOC65_001064 [Neochlamydia sp. AcF65]|uniref:hypothetical protein n=1 Tax=Neochlamydia sp. AcF65 TaxID=2795735 RepID=UPI001BCA504B|nr:hypothetical protein [Neochlamydia sp. AcF65]MBS4165987.1 Uncharacterized protein [Neochlamydia sp. AcF65]
MMPLRKTFSQSVGQHNALSHTCKALAKSTLEVHHIMLRTSILYSRSYSIHRLSLPIATRRSILQDRGKERLSSDSKVQWAAHFHQLTKSFRQPTQSVKERLPVVIAIKKALKVHGACIVQGAPGTGKSEQIRLAVKDPTTFDLKKRFLTSYFEKHESTDQEQEHLWREGYYKLKGHELKWLQDNYESIKKGLLESSSDTILLDEFDLVNTASLEGEALEIAELIANLAQELRKEGKKVVLVLHEQGINSPSFRESLNEQGIIKEPGAIVQTDFIPEEHQKAILELMKLSTEEKLKAIGYVQGTPGAYVKFLQRLEQGEPVEQKYKDFLIEAHSIIMGNLAVMEKIYPEIYTTLLAISSSSLQQRIQELNEIPAEKKQELLKTRMVGNVDGKLVLPSLVCDVLQDQVLRKDVEILRVNGKSLKLLEEEQLTDKVAQNLRMAAHHADKYAGSHSLLSLEGIQGVIPDKASLIKEAWRAQKEAIAHKINLEKDYQTERSSSAHLSWTNDASTIAELHASALEVKSEFLAMVEATCQESGVYSFHGDASQFLIKTQVSMNRKASIWAGNGADFSGAVKKLNDTIRTTFMANNIDEMRQAIHIFAKESRKRGYEIVFSNKFKEDYPSGYVGIHAKIYLKTPYTGKRIMGEVQFHFLQVHDGTNESVKEMSHRFLDQVMRKLEDNASREKILESTGLSNPRSVIKLCEQVQLNLFGASIDQIKIG